MFTATVHAILKRKYEYMARFAISQKRTSGVMALIYIARGHQKVLVSFLRPH